MADKEHEREEHDIQLPDLARPEAQHEVSDINVWAVGKFAIALGILCILSMAVLFGLFKYFLSVTGGPVARETVNVDARTLPPEPRLQQAPITDLKEMRAAEDKLLNGYGWVDQQHGIVRVPIDRAMDILAQRGLPSRPQNGPQSASTATVPKESGLGPIMNQVGGPLTAQAANGGAAQTAAPMNAAPGGAQPGAAAPAPGQPASHAPNGAPNSSAPAAGQPGGRGPGEGH